MPTVDEQLEALLRDAAPRPTTAGLDERLARRRRARSHRKRIGNAVLIVAVFAGTIAGFLALSRAFDRGSIPLGQPPATASASVEPDVPGARGGDLNCEPASMTGDVDGNHVPDIVRFSATDPCGREHHLVISLGNGGRSVETTLECGDACVLFSVTDLNADGIDEILVYEGALARPVSGTVGVYEVAADRLAPVTFPGGSNAFPLRDLWTGYRGAYCERPAILTLWFTVGQMSYDTRYRLDLPTLRFGVSRRTVTRHVLGPQGRERIPSETGYDGTMCGRPTVQLG